MEGDNKRARRSKGCVCCFRSYGSALTFAVGQLVDNIACFL